ncbi:benzoate/H(+) symporter BenE family transporter [Cupriavidus basilensis]
MSTATAPLKLTDLSVSALVAGLIAMLTGHTSSRWRDDPGGPGGPPVGCAGCLLDLGVIHRHGRHYHRRFALADTCSYFVIAWSTPGAALLIASLARRALSRGDRRLLDGGAADDGGGLTRWFDKPMRALPASIASALLAGILFRISVDVFVQAQQQTQLLCW